MAISSQGIGSGLDVNSIVTQLVAIEKQPLKTLQTAASKLQSQVSVYGTVTSQIATFQDAATKVAEESAWTIQKATSSNATAVSVTAGSATVASSLSLDVTQLARVQSFTSVPVTEGTKAASAGTLSIQLGSWSGSAFTGSNTAVDVSISVGDTVAQIASAINKAPNVGVTATRMWDQVNKTERLLITSKSTGEAAGFQVVAPSGTDLTKYGFTNATNTVSATTSVGVPAGASVSQTYTNAKAAFDTYTADKKSFVDYQSAKTAYDNYQTAKTAYDNYQTDKSDYGNYVTLKQAYDNYPAAKSVYTNYLVTVGGYEAAKESFRTSYETVATATYSTYQEALDGWLAATPATRGGLVPPLDPFPLGGPTDPDPMPANPPIVANPGATGPADPGATGPVDPGATGPVDPDTLPSGVVSSPDPSASAGTLSIQLGNWAGATFKGSSTALNVAIAVGDTFAQIADKVNAAFSSASTGIVATVVPDGGSEQLKFSYRGAIGEATGFRITNTGGDLSNIAVEAKVAVADVGSSQLAQDAKVKVNGVEMAFASNNLVDITPGVTLKLNQIGSADINVEPDKDAVQAKVQAFADAYTALNKTLADATKYVPGGQSGVLQGDSTTVGLQRLLRQMISSTTVGSGSAFTNLSKVGLELQTDGSLKLNAASLSTAMADMTGLQTLFTFVADPAKKVYDKKTDGFGVKLRELTKELLNTSGGSTSVNKDNGYVTNKAAALQAAITRNSYEQDKVTTRASAVEKRLRTQYSALDAKMATMSSLSSYVTAQLAQWNKTTN